MRPIGLRSPTLPTLPAAATGGTWIPASLGARPGPERPVRNKYMKPAVLLALGAITLFAAGRADLEARKVRARALLEQMDFAAAFAEAEAVNRAWPDDIETYQLMAAAQLELGNYAAAEKQLQWML